MSKIRRAVIFSALTRYSVMLIGLVSTMVVARLLTPDEIGTFAVGSAVVMLISEFRILGAGAYLVREKELTEQKVRAALGLTILISWGLGVAVIVAAPVVASFYELIPVRNIFWILSIGFFVAPVVSVASALLARQLKFDQQLHMQVAGALVMLITTVILIYAGASFYALAWGQMAGAITRFFVVVVFLRPEEMTYRPAFGSMKPVARVGVYSSLASVVRRATIVAPDLIIGKAGTTYEVGIFSRGLGFIQFVADTLMMSVTPVALPYLAGTRRDGGDIRAAYQRASVLMGGILWPVLAVGSLASLPAIRLFFGDQWDAAAPLAFWLAFWAALRSVHWFSNEVLLAVHKERLMAIKEVVIFVMLLAGITLAYAGGLERIAQVFMLIGFLEVMFITCLLKITVDLQVSAFVRAWLPNVATAGLCALVTVALRQVIDFERAPPWQPAIALVLVMPPVWLLLLWLFRHPLFNEIAGVLERAIGKGDKKL